MKKVHVILTGMLCLLLSLTVKAQEQKKDTFAGKWDVLVEGTPSGDAKMVLTLERVEGKLAGTILKPGDKEPIKIKRVEEKEKSATVYFTTSGYDVYLFMETKDVDHFTGSMMDMFDAKGVRIKEDVK